MKAQPRIVIVTPALADANNGNWQTARRWARMLSKAYRVRIASEWRRGDDASNHVSRDESGDDESADDDLLIALHARRSAPSVARWKAARPDAPAVVVLTGTDLYRDIVDDAAAQATLRRADRLVVLNAHGIDALPTALRARAHVILQSTTARAPLAKSSRRLRALTVGHLRDEKSPRTLFDAVRLLDGRADLLFDHVGAALDDVLGAEARALMATRPRYRWLDARPHAETRARIQRAHVLIHPSRIEGGAHVVIEAVRSGTVVLASDIDGNLGLLGDDYAGSFAVGDAAALARAVMRLRDDPVMLPLLQRQCAAIAERFDPAREAASLRKVVDRALQTSNQKDPS